jgi:hypothetical protein
MVTRAPWSTLRIADFPLRPSSCLACRRGCMTDDKGSSLPCVMPTVEANIPPALQIPSTDGLEAPEKQLGKKCPPCSFRTRIHTAYIQPYTKAQEWTHFPTSTNTALKSTQHIATASTFEAPETHSGKSVHLAHFAHGYILHRYKCTQKHRSGHSFLGVVCVQEWTGWLGRVGAPCCGLGALLTSQLFGTVILGPRGNIFEF